MKAKLNKTPEIVYRNGRPAAVILDIKAYRDMLDRLEDREDIRELDRMRKRKLKFRTLDQFLKDRTARG